MTTRTPLWLQWYKKPSYVDLKVFASTLNKKAKEQQDQPESPRISTSSSHSELAIPKDLTLERILDNRTCSPMSLYDFYMYLKHIEFSQENLEFYIWFKDYEARYRKLPKLETKEAATQTEDYSNSNWRISVPTTNVRLQMKGKTKADKKGTSIESNSAHDFTALIESLVLQKTAQCSSRGRFATQTKPVAIDSIDIEKDGGEKWHQPLSPTQMHQHELQHIVSLFLTPGGPKELNIPPSTRKAVVANINRSIDSPDNFERVAGHIYAMLKDCSHRNFVRLGVNNGTFETLCMVTFVGILFTISGFFTMFLLAFTSPRIHESSRWRGLACIPFWLIGISFLLAGMRGSCFLLLLFSRRQELPWERVMAEDGASVVGAGTGTGISSSVTRHHDSNNNNINNHNHNKPKTKLKTTIQGRLSAFTKKLMIAERKIRVKDIGLRQLQHRIVLQSIAGAIVVTTVLEVGFLALPVWRS